MAATQTRTPRRQRLQLDTLAVESFAPQTVKVDDVWADALSATDCPATRVDSGCLCCSNHGFTCTTM